MFQTKRFEWRSVQKWFNFNFCSLNAESFPFDVYDQDKNLILEFLGPQNQSWGPKQKFGQEYIQAKFGKTDICWETYLLYMNILS